MDTNLLQVALRNGALYIEPERPLEVPEDPENPNQLSKSTVYCLEELVSNGFTLDEKALHMLNPLNPEDKADIIKGINEATGKELNWTPLVRGWDVPTYETKGDHLITLLYNLFNSSELTQMKDAVKLPCGHFIPNGTFDLKRYTGCPFCGMPFETNDFVYTGQGSKFKVLTGWNEDAMYQYFVRLLKSTVPLSGGQMEDLETLIDSFEFPDVDIPMRETAIACAVALLDYNEVEKAKRLLTTPADVLRMLWWDHTDQLQLVKPKTLLLHELKACEGMQLFEKREKLIAKRNELKLKYNRQQCRQMADILNSMPLTAEKACEIMHPDRGMWVRFIRALRLAEYSHRKGYEKLREILDRFYRQDYTVAQGIIDKALRANDYDTAVKVLSKRPGMFARQLFSLMLRYNPYRVLADFQKVLDKVTLRLLVSLSNNAEFYFHNESDTREVKTITGEFLQVPVNQYMDRLSVKERLDLIDNIRNLILDALSIRYGKTKQPGQKIYIDPALFNVVLPIGDRVKATEYAMSVPQGTAFDVLGDKIRIFLHWGKGMAPAPIDLDISALVVYDDKTEVCNYTSLTITGLTHSGDMRNIPDQVGTAEYIEINVPELRENRAKYVVFTANQYTYGNLQANAMVGWMDSAFPMHISAETGVAYDPSCVQHMVKVNDSELNKGVVFGVLDVKKNQVIWLNMPFEGRSIFSLDYTAVVSMLYKLSTKITIGKALETYAKAKDMVIVKKDEIDENTEVFDRKWAYDMTAVVETLIPADNTDAANEKSDQYNEKSIVNS